MSIRIIKWPADGSTGPVADFLNRRPFDEKAQEKARRILADIRKNGNRAVSTYVKRFDGVSLRAGDFAVTKAELAAARASLSAGMRAAVREAHKRIVAFAKASLRKDWWIPGLQGGKLGERFLPLDRVGVYVPGGAAPLASTALMTATLAEVAGVPEIVACTPCCRGRRPAPVVLHALDVAGATEIYRVGGIQAVGLMAYGTRTIRKVQKIAGPGGPYVTAAKRLVYGDVAVDLVAGPSEMAVLADDSANAGWVAADLLSQAEHGTGMEKALLVTTSMELAKQVRAEIETQSRRLTRQKAVRKVMAGGILLVVVKTVGRGMDLCNEFAPEHLELMVRHPGNWLKKVRRAGAVFVGRWSPVPSGDFVAGPSHVLPTGGTAAMFSGLTVDDFRRRTSFVSFTRADLRRALPTIEAFGRVEGLDAHIASARMRFEKS